MSRCLIPLFFAVFFGTAAGCILLAVRAVLLWNTRGAGYLLVGCALYLVGTILVTIFFNVPLNNALAAVDPTSGDGARLWNDYVASWTAWNHVRTIAALAAAASLTIAVFTMDWSAAVDTSDPSRRQSNRTLSIRLETLGLGVFAPALS